VVLDVDGLVGDVFGLPVDPMLLLPVLPDPRRAFVSMKPLGDRELLPVALLDALDDVDPAVPVSAPLPPCFKQPVTVTFSREPRL